MGAYNYLYGCPDSDEEDYDPSHECFHMEVEEIAPGDATPAGQGVHTPLRQVLPTGPPREWAVVSALERSRRAELGQLCELEAKIDEDCQQLVHLQATLEQERSGRGDGGVARHGARNIYRRINIDEGGDQPPFFARASQNIATVAMLLRTMLEPSTAEGQQVHNELRGLLECTVVQQAESSTSRRREPEAEPLVAPSRQEREALVRPELQRAPEHNKAPSVRNHPGDGTDRASFSMHADTTRRMAPHAAITHAEADTTIARGTKAPHPSLWVPVSSARPSGGLDSQPDSINQPTLSSTLGK
jgi:hypothetical protein